MISTFTVSEIGGMVPNHIASFQVRYDEDGEPWTCIKYIAGGHAKYEHLEIADTEANCRTKMLIYLAKNKLVTV